VPAASGDPERSDPELAWARGGWAPRSQWTTRTPDGEQVVLSLRLPLRWRAADLLDPAAPVAAGTPADRVRKVTGLPGGFTPQRLALDLVREGEPTVTVLATMTALLLAPGATPSDPGPERNAAPPLGHYQGTLSRELRTVRGGPDAHGSLSLLVVTALLRTPFGVLSITFSAPQAPFHDRLEPLFRQMVQTVRLDRASAATPETG
jgi:hypothetical protein